MDSFKGEKKKDREKGDVAVSFLENSHDSLCLQTSICKQSKSRVFFDIKKKKKEKGN